jgi:predicted helicase
MYTCFLRWASDRLGDNGLIAFVTNRSFIDARAFDGFRKCIEKEFNAIYIVDVGGDIRLGDVSGNVFDIKVGVAVMCLVRTKKEKN